MSDVVDIMDGLSRRTQAAQSQAVSTVNDSPDDAQRAIELGEATGVPPTTISGDLEGFQQKHKAALAGNIIKGNPQIQDYVMSHPMAAKLSNDDYGQLDAVSQSLGKLGSWGPSREFGKSVMGAGVEAFKSGLGEGRLGGWAGIDYNDPDQVDAHPIAASWAATLTGVSDPFEAGFRLLSGVVFGALGAGGEAYKQLTGDERGPQIADTIAQAVQDPGLMASLGPLGEMISSVLGHNAKLGEALQKARPYAESGVVPPVGVHELIDKVHKEQSKNDLKNLDKAFKESQASKTHERNPDMFAGFVEQHTDASIGISGDAVAKLYGDKVPSPEDGILGHMVPDLAEQLEEAKQTGGDVRVPLSEWLAKADPEVAKELHDHIRVRPEGLTKEEAKELKPEYTDADVSKMDVSGDHPEFTKLLEEEKAANDAYHEQGKTVGDIRDSGDKQALEASLDEGERLRAIRDAATKKVNEWKHPPEDATQQAVDTIRQAAFPASSGFEKYLEKREEILPTTAKPGGSPVMHGDVVVKPRASFLTKEGLQFIKRDHLSPLSRQLYDLVGAKLSEMVGQVPVKIMSQADVDRLARVDHPQAGDGETAGLFIPKIRQIAISENIVAHPRMMSYVMFHEAVHAFTLEALARDEGIFNKTNKLLDVTKAFLDKVDPAASDRVSYAWQNADEFMSEAYSKQELQFQLAKIPLSPELAAEIGLGKGKFTVWDGIRKLVKNLIEKMLGRSIGDTMLDAALHMGKEIEAFNKQFVADAKAKREAKRSTTPMDERDPFEKAASIGMTKDQLAHYEELIAKRNAEDLAAAKTRAEKEQRKKQTDEWKRNTVEERKQAADDVNARPDVMADTFLRDKSLSTKLDPDSLTPEQRKGLPKEYFSEDGISADDMASSFGYQTGDSMVAHLAAYNDQIKQSGMRPELFKRRLIDAETERRMQSKYGDLEKNILDEAKDQALSETQENLLHEQVLAAAERAGVKPDSAQYPLTKDQIKSGVQKLFADKINGDVDSNKNLAEAGKAHRQAEIHLLDGKFADAFRESQRGEVSTMMAREAIKLEKEKAAFDKKAKTLGKPNKNISPEYSNAIQTMLTRIGKRTTRDLDAIQRDLSKEGYNSFKEFVEDKSQSELQDLHVPDFMLDENFKKQYDDLTVQEFRQVRDSVKAIEKYGREDKKVYHQGEAAEWADVKKEMLEQIRDIGPAKVYPYDRKLNTRAEQAKSWWWSAINIESMANRFDKGDPNGVFHKYLIYPFTSASNYKDRLLKQFQKKLDDAGINLTREYMDKQVDNSIWHDPITGQLLPMRKRNVMGILAYRGNKSSWEKLLKGYGVEPDIADAWLKRNTSKEDWGTMQKVGHVFDDLFSMADEMSYKTSDVGIQKLPLEPFTNPHGDVNEGWYNPVKYDAYRPGKSKKLLGGETEASAYYKATTPQGYTKQRTGYVAPVELNMDIIPQRMKQMIHDIAMRPAVQQVSKVFRDPEFKRTVIAHYGRHQAEEMMSFLTDMAGAANFKSFTEQLQGQSLEYYRQNLIAGLIGFNPGTVMKHGTTALVNSMQQVGIVNWSREFATLMQGSEEGNKSNWRMAMDNSMELQRRMRNFTELIEGHGQELKLRGAQSNFDSFRDIHIAAGATPVSISDLLSSVPTWLAQYKKLVAEGMDKGSAIEQADMAVRQAHGSSVLTNRPSIMRANPLGQWFTSLYGFFNHMQQKQYEIAWRYKDAMGMAKQGDYAEALKAGVVPTRMLVGYLIIPALIEELVTPYSNNDKESWGVKAAKTLGLGLSSSLVGVRDFAHGLLGGRGGEAGLISTAMSSITNVAHDIGKGKITDKASAGKVFHDVIALNGLLNGLTNNQEGKIVEYLTNYFQGHEKPKGPWSVATGLRYGHTKGHSQSLNEYVQQMKGK
jgi:hypothetical protein